MPQHPHLLRTALLGDKKAGKEIYHEKYSQNIEWVT
jgi:hypothetical protein